MRKGMDLINIPVVDDDGAEIERVKGLVLDQTEQNVISLLLETNVDTRKARVVQLQDVCGFGEDCVVIASSNVVRSLDLVPEVRLVLYPYGPMTGTKLLTCQGVVAGTVNDLSFDEHTGKIDVFEISDQSCTNSFFERPEIPLLEEVEQGVLVHEFAIQPLSDRE